MSLFKEPLLAAEHPMRLPTVCPWRLLRRAHCRVDAAAALWLGRVPTAPMSLTLVQVRKNETYSKKQKVLPLEITKEILPTLMWRQIEKLVASGQLSKKVTIRFANERGMTRARRPKDAVIADLLLAWPASQETVSIA